MESGDKILGIAAALGSAASWAVGAILFKRLGDQMSSFGMTLAKGAMSVILLGIAVCVMGFEAMDSHTVMLMVLSGVVGIAVGDTFFFKALKDIGPVSMIVLMVIGQVLTILLAVIFLHETPSVMEWAGIGLILTGVFVTLSADLSGDRQSSGWRGVMFGLASVVCMSVSYIIIKTPLENISSLQATFMRMAAGTVGVFIVGMMSGQVGGWLAPLKGGAFLAEFFVAVCVVTFGGFLLAIVAMKHLDVSIANTLNSTEPIFVIPLAYLVLKEKINTRSIIGAVSVVAGVALIFLNSPLKTTT